MENKIENITIGSDIEVFLKNKAGKNISAEGFIPGTKYEPMKVEKLRTLSIDNVAAEFTINPVTTLEAWVEEINTMKKFVADFVRPNELELDIYPARNFDEDQLQTENAIMFGCEPDYNIRKWLQNDAPLAVESNLRSCGGHLHFAWPKFTPEDGAELIAALDVFLALPMMFLEEPNKRRELYGKSSCVRMKHYGKGLQGIEYRTLSNWWTRSDELITYVWNGIQKAIDFVNEGKVVEDWAGICEAIDNNDVDKAREYMRNLSIQI
jgi:hypothetical protein